MDTHTLWAHTGVWYGGVWAFAGTSRSQGSPLVPRSHMVGAAYIYEAKYIDFN